MDFLNHCTHKYIIQEIDKKIAERKQKKEDTCIVLDAPLLLEANLENRCSEIWVVFAEEEVILLIQLLSFLSPFYYFYFVSYQQFPL